MTTETQGACIIMAGAAGENPDDCTTHDHEVGDGHPDYLADVAAYDLPVGCRIHNLDGTCDCHKPHAT